MNEHHQRFDVHSYEVDAWGRMTATALAGYLQEVAGVHADRLDCGLQALVARGLTWVLVRQRLELDHAVRGGESLEIVTWPSGQDRMAALREYEIRRGDGPVIGRASSAWFVLDLETRRPVRPTEVLPPALLEPHKHVLSPASDRLPAVETPDAEMRFPVRRGDIDVNQHANNASYLAWILDAVPETTWRARLLHACDVQYIAECRHGETVISRLVTDDGGESFRHSVVRESDSKELARAVTCWK